MKKIKLLLGIILPMIAFAIPANAYGTLQVDNMSENEERFFVENNITSSTIENVEVDGVSKKLVIQEFEQKIPVLTRDAFSNAETYTMKKGVEIIDYEIYLERENKKKMRITTTDRYADGRGTYLYGEIQYTKSNALQPVYNMTYLYCNSSGSTLTAYSVTYGQSGLMSNTVPVTQTNTVNINTTTKTFEKYLSWKGITKGIAGMTQKYTCRGWSNSWTLNILNN